MVRQRTQSVCQVLQGLGWASDCIGNNILVITAHVIGVSLDTLCTSLQHEAEGALGSQLAQELLHFPCSYKGHTALTLAELAAAVMHTLGSRLNTEHAVSFAEDMQRFPLIMEQRVQERIAEWVRVPSSAHPQLLGTTDFGAHSTDPFIDTNALLYGVNVHLRLLGAELQRRGIMLLVGDDSREHSWCYMAAALRACWDHTTPVDTRVMVVALRCKFARVKQSASGAPCFTLEEVQQMCRHNRHGGGCACPHCAQAATLSKDELAELGVYCCGVSATPWPQPGVMRARKAVFELLPRLQSMMLAAQSVAQSVTQS